MRFSRLAMSAGLGLALAAPSLPLAAQPPAPAAASARADGRAAVAEVRRIIAERYVLPERRPALDAILAQGLASGRYDGADPVQIAERINADLDTAGHDRHLNFRYDPQAAAGLAARTAQGEPDEGAFERQARAANHGVTELRVLPGNVRYMAYDGFMWIGPESAAALETAMRFLAGGDAVIIDIRRNGGGSPDAVQYLVSHFLPPGRPLVTFHMNGQATPNSLSTLAELPAGRMVGKPLYVLTSGGTASAAEEFSGHVGGYRIGELVGETTAGAGFRNELVPVAGGFVLSVSVGRAVLASTGRDWEAVGLAPTVPTAVAGALDVAHALALRRLAAAAPAQARPRLEALADGVAARGERRSPALPLAAYAGSYGERVLSVEDGRLFYRRGTRPRTALIPLGGNAFAIDTDPALRLEFQVAGAQAAAFEMRPAGGPSQGRFARTP
ncbi:MAG: hypothetical protein QOD42_2379 [Sphingomonadales bacterium]|jgi:hypothetical protein|nr:hypothetical protein [Sphingomonadales bacterium]